MNENDMQKNYADPCDTTECDPLPSEAAEPISKPLPPCAEESANASGIPLAGCTELVEELPETDVAEAPAAPSLPADPDPHSDLDPSSPPEADPTEQLQQLRDELSRLRAEMAQQATFFSRMGLECEEFRTLYPQASLADLPDCVWEDVKQGIPIAAAYALAERRRAYTESLAAVANQKGRQCSSGALASTDPDYFSPGEVRAMSQAEVRANYQKIMRSMPKWH